MLLNSQKIDDLELKYRIHLMNSITGFKSANLIATYNDNGYANAALFSSVTHYGSNPSIIGMTIRPPSPRHQTYPNIKRDGYYTINQVNSAIYAAAHQTSGNFEAEISEFEVAKLTEEKSETFPWAPYVKESRIRLGMKLIEEHHIKVNGTILVLGEIMELHCDGEFIEASGHVDHEKAQTVSISGLDGYYRGSLLERLPRVKVN